MKCTEFSETYDTQADLYSRIEKLLPRPLGNSNLKFVVPISKGVKTFSEFTDFLRDHNFQAHLLKGDLLYVRVEFDSASEADLLELDRLTSTVIKRGGTVQPSDREALRAVSPFLAKRIMGEYNLPLQQSIKELFDPNLVLVGDGMREEVMRERAKSRVQKLREANKQVNFYMTKFGL